MASTRWANPRLQGRIPELDGIRGLAILLVLIWHYAVASLPAGSDNWLAYALIPFRLTWSGVDLFFVLSGFLIGGILLDAKESANYFQTFYARRFFRIVPIYALWMTLFAAGLFFTGQHPSPALHGVFNQQVPAWSYPLFVQNFFTAARQSWGAQWMGPTWSLAVEEQFYLLLPLVVRRLSRRGVTAVAVASIVIAPVMRWILWRSGNEQFGPYTLLPCRADALGFGVLIAIGCRERRVWDWLISRRRYLFSAFLILGCGVFLLIFWRDYLYVGGLSWIGIFYASLLLLALVHPGARLKRIFGSALLRNLGTVAYATYLFHQGINWLFHAVILGREPTMAALPSAAVTVLSAATVLVMAALSWRLIEKPLIRHAHANFRYEAEESVALSRDAAYRLVV